MADPREPTLWAVARPETARARALALELGVSALLAQVLLNRGLADPPEARRFLEPDLADLPDPELLPDAGAASRRIREALDRGERIAVWGDYDADGVSGTAMLLSFLRLCGADARSYLPDRSREGYGFNPAALRALAGEGVRLVVAVDHGTTAVDEIDTARSAGLDVVVLDHHQPGDRRPGAVALVNPALAGSADPAPCAAGVVFRILWLVARDMAGGGRVSEAHRAFLAEALGLAALGTVADVVPLRGENRLLARFGLRALGGTRRPGLRALLDVSGVTGRPPTATDVAYGLAPRINAAGRLGSADLALELLLTEEAARGAEIASALDRENRRRREIENGILALARERVEAGYAADHHGALVLADSSWHAGVIGIVAARLADRYRRPVALVAFDGDLGRGSCRSVPAVHLTKVLSKCAAHLETWGGHAAAAGFSIRAGRFEDFRRSFDDAVRESTTREDLLRRVRIDAAASLSDLTPAVVREIARLEPFGEGNPEPVFATRNLALAGQPRRMGRDGEHLSFIVSDGTTSRRAVGFRMGDRLPSLRKAGCRVDIAYTPRLDTWRGDGSVELELTDVATLDG